MGYIHVICAYLLWGIFPIFWKQLKSVPSVEVVFHRMFWSFIAMCLILSWNKKKKLIQTLKKNPKHGLMCIISALLIASNWFIFVWSVNAGFIAEASLGYFINPLFFVVVGALVFREKMRKGQIVAVCIATMGVLYLTFISGNFPYLALSLAVTFTLYGLIRKTIPLDTFEGLATETAFLSIPAAIYIFYLEYNNVGVFFKDITSAQYYLVLTGFVTIAPLLFFASAARKVPFYILGFFQYIAPTMQFLIGIFVYREVFQTSRLIGFCFVWFALIVFSCEGIWNAKRSSKG